MNFVHAILGSILALLASCGGRADAPVEREAKIGTKHIVVLSQSEMDRLGLQTEAAKSQQFTPRVHGYGVVIGLSTLAQTDADIQTARAAVADSSAMLERSRKLYGASNADHAVSQQALDTAEHQALSDRALLELADRKEVAMFGQHAPWRNGERDENVLTALSSGHTVLVQATFPLGISFDGTPELTITRLSAQSLQTGWTTKKTWDAPADPTIPGRSFFALVDNSALAEGEHVLIFAPTGPAVEGVEIPAEAVVLNEDRSWCYALIAPHVFQRVAIDLSQQTANGYFISKGVRPNERVVTKGAGLLLARELGAATPGQD